MIDTQNTPGPWVQFADQGKCIALMPAGRDGDICTFEKPPSDADAMLMNAAPEMLEALLEFVSTFSTVPGSIGDEVKSESRMAAPPRRKASYRHSSPILTCHGPAPSTPQFQRRANRF
jgi:hypothetical protein